MPEFLHPGVFVEEVSAQTPRPINSVPTSVVGFVGETVHIQKKGFDNDALINVPTQISSWEDFSHQFGEYDERQSPYLAMSVKGFFENDGKECFIVRLPAQASSEDYGVAAEDVKASLAALEAVDVNIICMPGVTDVAVQQAMITHCEKCRYRFCILDSPQTADVSALKEHRRHIDSSYGALYHPWLKVPGDAGESVVVPPSGFIAGIYAQVDAARGVHKAPANVGFNGAVDVLVNVNAAQQDILNPLHVNCLRTFPGKGVVVWGNRTLSSDPEWKYINVRRLLICLEASIERSTQWVAFEPNDAPLWASVRSAVGNYLYDKWREGMLTGSSPKEAYFVKYDRSTMTQTDIDSGRLILHVGVAPMRPAEFVIIRMSQQTQQ